MVQRDRTNARLVTNVKRVAAVCVTVFAGYFGTSWAAGRFNERMLPWIVGRGLGLAAYLTLTALTALGLWLRHPLHIRTRWPSRTAQLWLHATLAATTLALIAGHVVALCLDKYAGVGWRGAVVPGAASYRPTAVAYGSVACYLAVLVMLSTTLAGRLTGRLWLPIHRAAIGVFALVLLHGLTAGSDTARLRVLYVISGACIALLWLTRRLPTVQKAAPEGPTP